MIMREYERPRKEEKDTPVYDCEPYYCSSALQMHFLKAHGLLYIEEGVDQEAHAHWWSFPKDENFLKILSEWDIYKAMQNVDAEHLRSLAYVARKDPKAFTDGVIKLTEELKNYGGRNKRDRKG